MFLKQFEIRWSELDANRHVANSAYSDLLSEVRMSYLLENGVSHKDFADHNFGPVAFLEEFYYIKEVLPGETVRIGLELLAHTSDFKYVKLAHYVFNRKGELSLYSESLFGWFNLKERQLMLPPAEIVRIISHLSKADRYEVLSDDFTVKNHKIPYHKSLSMKSV